MDDIDYKAENEKLKLKLNKEENKRTPCGFSIKSKNKTKIENIAMNRKSRRVQSRVVDDMVEAYDGE